MLNVIMVYTINTGLITRYDQNSGSLDSHYNHPPLDSFVCIACIITVGLIIPGSQAELLTP